MRAAFAAIALFVLSASVAVAQTAAPAQPTLSLTRMGVSMRDGDVVGEAKFGAACGDARTLRWNSNSDRFDDARLRQVFREAMVNNGFQMTSGASDDLFARRSEAPDLQVGALVRSLRYWTCTSTRDREGMTHGSASIEVEWQIYSPTEGKVVAKLLSNGSYGTEQRLDGIIDRITAGAFKRAAEDLASDPAFARVVRSGLTRVAAGPPLTPLAVNFSPMHTTAIDRAGESVVSVVLPDSHGSGVLVSADGYVLTNHHVAGDAGKVRIVWADGSESQGQVLRTDRKRDVALIKVDTPKAQPLALRHDQLVLGETVYAIGTPLEKALAGTLTRGVVSGLRTTDGQPFIQSDVVVNHGNSGGPLLDERGQVIGLTVSGLEANGAPMGINFFIPIDDALKALAIQPVTVTVAAPPAASASPRRAPTSRK